MNETTNGPSEFANYPSNLNIDSLRVEIQSIIRHYADVFQCPIDFLTSTVFAIASTLCGKHITIEDGKYSNHPNLWICHIARSGTNKSAPVKALLNPIHAIESERYKEFYQAYKSYKHQPMGEEPKLVPITVSDTTPEGLYKILGERNESKDGLLLYRDEIKGFVDDIGRYHNSGEVSNYLSICDGTTFSVTRKTQQPLYVESPFLNMLGGIQPEAFGKAFNMGLAEVGFTQRWLYVYPDDVIRGFYSDKTLDSNYVYAWKETVEKLLSINDMTLGLSPKAKEAYIDFHNRTVVKEIDAHPFVCSMLSKLRIQVLKWCAVTHVLSSNVNAGAGHYFALPTSNIITEKEMESSIECMRYFEYCGHKALSNINGLKPLIERTQAEKIRDLVYSIGIDKVNKTKLAESLGKTRQYISKVLNSKSGLRGCGCDEGRSPPISGVRHGLEAQPKAGKDESQPNNEVAV